MSNLKSNGVDRKVVVVGAGAVGSTYAYALSQIGPADEELQALRRSAGILKEAIVSMSV